MLSASSAPLISPAPAHDDEVSRVVRISQLVVSIEPSKAERLVGRLDTWAAFAVVVLASSLSLCASVWILESWQLS